MAILSINGGARLDGAVRVQGSKNSVLPIMAASLLAEGETVIHNCPDLNDVDSAIQILRHLGCTVKREQDTLIINSADMVRCDIPDHLMREMRSSVMFMGAILSRMGKAVLSMPGGCELGPRPIDMHLKALQALGAEYEEAGGNIICTCKKLKGARVDFVSPSVGATENAMLAAVRADGFTVITNAAREPEIVDLQDYLNRLGARIIGAGTSVITVEGTKTRKYGEHTVIPDRIVAVTYLSAAVAAGGKVELNDVCPEHIGAVLRIFREMGCDVQHGSDYIRLRADGKCSAVRPITTSPYPGFPTDAQPPMISACLKIPGTTVFVENIFKNRYRHIPELLRMGADIKTEGSVAMVSGVSKLFGTQVTAADLRGGAALAVAALGAEGETKISGVCYIDRGYEKIERDLAALGADIKRNE